MQRPLMLAFFVTNQYIKSKHDCNRPIGLNFYHPITHSAAGENGWVTGENGWVK
jgi:hypothetical protein